MSISVTVSGEDSTSVVLTQALTDTVSVSGTSSVQVTTTSGDSATVTVSTGDPVTITGNYSNYVTGDVVRPSEISNFITSSDLSSLEAATGNLDTRVNENESDILTVSGLITSNDGDISALQTATGLLVQKSQTGNFVTDSDTGAFYPTSNPSGYITGVDLSNYVQNSETGNFITDLDTGAFYSTSNPSGFITGVDLSDLQAATGNLNTRVIANESGITTVSGLIASNDSDISALQTATGLLVQKSETGNFVTDSDTGAFYGASNPSGFVTGVDLSDLETATGVLKSDIVSNDNDISALQTATGLLVQKSETGNFITDSDTGAFYATSNPSGFITGVDLSSYVQDSETGLFLVSGEDAVVNTLQVGSTPAYSQTRSIKLHDNGVQFGARVSLVGTNDDGGPGFEMVTDGSLSKRTIIRHEGEGSNDYGLAFFTTNNSTVSEKVRFDGNGNVGIGIAAPTAKLHVIGDTLLSGDLAVTGNSFFENRPTVNGTGVLLSGEGGAVENVVYTTGDQEVSGVKNFSETIKVGKISLSENSFVTETGNFTLGSTHRGATVLLQNSAPMTITVPAQVSGHTTTFISETSSSVVFATGAGISGFNSFNSANQIAGIYGQAQIIFKSPEYAFLGGNVV